MLSLTPEKIVAELNRFVIGQEDAKRAVAIALRNRWRRKQLPEKMREEVMPHNILMVGSTGVGKTEIARRLAKLANAPFLKIEATKFTEVGYVGRDVDSIIRDLLDIAIKIVKSKVAERVEMHAGIAAESRIIEALVGVNSSEETKNKFYEKLRSGSLNDTEVEIAVLDVQKLNQDGFAELPGMSGAQVGLVNLSEVIGKMIGDKKYKTIKTKISEAYQILKKEESDKMTDKEAVIAEAIKVTEEDGIVFLDEIDKIASRNHEGGARGEVSREGVQRDLLPLVEGTVVNTKYGPVRTNHILFIASGAFHISQPSDLLPELQGRLPIRVQLKSLSEGDLVRILQDTEHSIIKQYIAMLGVEGVTIDFTVDGIAKIAKIASEVNSEIENIGARRLHTIMEKLLDDVSFNASQMMGQSISINEAYVDSKLEDLVKKQDLTRFLL